MRPGNLIRNLDPYKLAYYEKENYVGYYQKDWLKLLRVSVGMVKEAFGLSWLQAIYGAYLIARAEVAFAPFPNNDIPRTESYVKRFYRFIKRIIARWVCSILTVGSILENQRILPYSFRGRKRFLWDIKH